MTQRNYQREQPNLLDIIAGLADRVKRLETYPRSGATSIDNGALTLRGGDIIVTNDEGETVLRIVHGNSPLIEMAPSGNAIATNYKVSAFGWESDFAGTAYQVSIQDGNGNQDGGKLLLMQGGAYLSWQPASGDEAYLSLGAIDGIDDSVYFRGRWPNNTVFTGTEAVVVGTVNIGAGASSYSHTYSTPLNSTPAVVYGLLNSAGAVTHSLTANSASGFTVAWSGTLAKTLYFIAMRTS